MIHLFNVGNLSGFRLDRQVESRSYFLQYLSREPVEIKLSVGEPVLLLDTQGDRFSTSTTPILSQLGVGIVFATPLERCLSQGTVHHLMHYASDQVRLFEYPYLVYFPCRKDTKQVSAHAPHHLVPLPAFFLSSLRIAASNGLTFEELNQMIEFVASDDEHAETLRQSFGNIELLPVTSQKGLPF